MVPPNAPAYSVEAWLVHVDGEGRAEPAEPRLFPQNLMDRQEDGPPLYNVRVAGFACYLALDVTAHVAAQAARGARGVAFALLNAETSDKTNTWASRRAGPDTAPQLLLEL